MELYGLTMSFVAGVADSFPQDNGCDDVGTGFLHVFGEFPHAVSRGHDVVEEQYLAAVEIFRGDGILWQMLSIF